jgi:uncharacterized protein YhjY with autotransporter beta-barrel domain
MAVSKPTAPDEWARRGTVSNQSTVVSAQPSVLGVARAILLVALLLSCGTSLAQINVTISLRPAAGGVYGQSATVSAGVYAQMLVVFQNTSASPVVLAANDAGYVQNMPAGVTLSVANSGTVCGSANSNYPAQTATQLLLNGGTVPANGQCSATVDVTAAQAGVYTFPIGTVTPASGQIQQANGPSAVLTVLQGPTNPPTIAAAFGPANVAVGAQSTLTVTLSSTNAQQAALTDPLTVTAPPNLTFSAAKSGITCDIFTIAPGGGSFTYPAGRRIINGQNPGSCNIVVNVTASAPGKYSISIPAGALITSEGNNVVGASATLQVGGTAPSVAVAFSPSTVNANAPSTVNITLGNTNATAATLTNAFTDTLPAGVVVAKPTTIGGSCPSGSVTAAAGSGTITYANNATVPANGGCTITVRVVAAAQGTYTDSIAANALQTNLGNSAAASAKLTVQKGGTVAVPAVTGETVTAAQTAINGAGLKSQTHAQVSSKPANTVISQTPAAGTLVAAGTTVTLVVSQGQPPSNLHTVPGLTPTQVSAASAVENTCYGLKNSTAQLSKAQMSLGQICTAMVKDNGVNAKNGLGSLTSQLNAVSGRQSTATQQTSINFSGLQAADISARFAQLRQGATGLNLSGLNLGEGLPNGSTELLAELQDLLGLKDLGDVKKLLTGGGSGDADRGVGNDRLGFFINGNLRRGSHDQTANEADYNFRSNGVTAGVDYRFSHNMVWGLAYTHESGDTDFPDGSARIDGRSNLGTLYGTWYHGPLYIDWFGTYGHTNFDSTRNITVQFVTQNPCASATNQCNATVTGSTGATQYGAGTSAGYTFHSGGWSIGPDIALDYARVNVDSFTEQDPSQSGLALGYESQTGKSLLLKAGGFAAYAVSVPFGVLLPQARLHYLHEFMNDQQAVTAHYAAAPTITTAAGVFNSNFVVFTDQPKRDYLEWAINLTAQFKYGISAFVDYSSLADAGFIHARQFSFGIRVQPQMQ